jgi:hypothetical protein
MSKVHNFSNDFTIHVENEMPKIINRLNEESNKFSALTLGLYTIMGVVERALAPEGYGFMSINFEKQPELNTNFVRTTKFTIANLNDRHDIEICYIGGNSTEATIEGAIDFSHHFGNLKNAKIDVFSKTISIPLDTPADDLAAAFATLFTEFYSAE